MLGVDVELALADSEALPAPVLATAPVECRLQLSLPTASTALDIAAGSTPKTPLITATVMLLVDSQVDCTVTVTTILP